MFSCPDVHFICTAFPDRTGRKAGVTPELIVFDGIIHDSRHLVIDGLQIRLGIRTSLFISVINHGILPPMDHDRGNVTDLHIFKEWQQFHVYQILLIFQSGQFQPGAAV